MTFKGSAWLIMHVPLSVWQGYCRDLFQFEDDRFDNVPALIRYYVGGQRPISKASGAVICRPVPRTVPLRVIIERQTEPKSSSNSAAGGKHTDPNKRLSLSTTHTDTLQVNNPLLRWEEVHWILDTLYVVKEIQHIYEICFRVWQEWKSAC